MKLSELKEQIKELYLQEQNSVEDIEAQTKATQDLTAAKKELKAVTMSEFKNYLRNEILAEIAEQEDEEEVSDDVEIETSDEEVEAEPTTPELPQDPALELDDIGDTLLLLAKKAKKVGERELANQILNSTKFAKKTEFKKVQKDAGIGDEEV